MRICIENMVMTKKDETILSQDDYNRKFEDLQLQREQDELEINHENIFEGRSFDPTVFNKMFEKKKRRDDKKKMSGALAKYNNDISAFNDFDDSSGGVPIDNYENLYSDDKYTSFHENYSGIGSGLIGNDNHSDNYSDNHSDNHTDNHSNGHSDGHSDDDISIDSPDHDEYDSHNKGVSKENLDDAMKRMMAERNEQNDLFETMTTNDYGSALDDKYGVSNQFGFMVGNNMQGHQKNTMKRDVKDETIKAYKKLTSK